MDNILPGFLIGFFILFFLVSFWIVLKTQDDLFAVFYGLLFIYTIFTQIGYVYYPEVATKYLIYFGINLFYSYWWFVFLSFAATVGLFLICNSPRKNRSIEKLLQYYFKVPRILFFLVVGVYLILLIVLFSLNYENIRYANIENIWIAYMINSQPMVILVIYMKMRKSSIHRIEKWITMVMFSIAFLLFFVISFRAGQRLLGLSLLVGITVFELGPFSDVLKKKRAHLLMMVFAGLIFLFIAGRIVDLRDKYSGEAPLEAINEFFMYKGDKGDQTYFEPERILQNDYFAPSSLIFVSMFNNWIYPGEVLKSNIYNIIPFTKYPYLQNILSEEANTSVSYSRTESYGYYLLTEGFNIAGWWGILYNAVMINLLLSVWRFFASSRDHNYNRCMNALLCMMVIGIVRGPSVFFVRNVYLSILPAMVLISISLGYYPRWTKNSSRASTTGRTGSSIRLPHRGKKSHPCDHNILFSKSLLNCVTVRKNT